MLTRTRMTLLVETGPDTEPEEVEVEVRAGDQLVGESVAQRNGIGPLADHPISHTIVWAYCAARREGKYAGEFQQFRNDLITFTEDKGDPVDPTVGPDNSVSPWPPTSETPDSGSTLT